MKLPQYRFIRREEAPLETGMSVRGVRLSYTAEAGFGRHAAARGPALSTPFEMVTFEEFAGLADAASFFDDPPGAEEGGAEPLYLHAGGWQSWSPGWELAPEETLPEKIPLLPDLIKLVNRPGDTLPPAAPEMEAGERFPRGAVEIPGAGWLPGHFIMYFRRGEQYLCAASRGGGSVPPVSFRIHRGDRRIIAEVYAPGKIWQSGETAAEIAVFAARGYFTFRDILRRFYDQEDCFGKNAFLWDGGKRYGGYASWYHHYTSINEALMIKDLAGLLATDNFIKNYFLDRGRSAVFQIDDGWERAAGDWEANERRFPRGLQFLAARITDAGLVPGLWLAPFIVTRKSRVFREHPSWLLRDGSGKPVSAGWNPNWDGSFYCLDISREDVRDHLRRLMEKVVTRWGFRYLKLDFLYAGMLPGAFARGGDPAGHYRRAAAILTEITAERTGKPVAYLGCGVPLGSSYRHFPLSRIGADTRESWDWLPAKLLGHLGRPSAYISLKDTIGRAFMNGAVYQNDPDVIFFRTENCRLAETEKELVALVNFMFGSQIMLSDDPHRESAGGSALARRMAALYDELDNDEYGAHTIGKDVYRLESRSGKTAGVINLSSRAVPVTAVRDPSFRMMLASGRRLVDNRTRDSAGNDAFAPHSISICRAGQ
ncbi:MAG: alpha-galactosidase [Spirochaetaceae bacterium]|nr:alpha-galactosidase [Spirochaetaceae bacterium]